MQQETISAMARFIHSKNNLLNIKDLTAALNEFWAGKIAVIWTRADILLSAWQRSLLLTNAQADEILGELLRHHDAEQGITWMHIENELDLIADEAFDPESAKLENLPDYPGEYRVYWTQPSAPNYHALAYNQSADFTADFQGGNLRAALAFAAQKASAPEVTSEVQVCVMENNGVDHPLAYYWIDEGGNLVICRAKAD
jgi:hypothetical protein